MGQLARNKKVQLSVVEINPLSQQRHLAVSSIYTAVDEFLL